MKKELIMEELFEKLDSTAHYLNITTVPSNSKEPPYFIARLMSPNGVGIYRDLKGAPNNRLVMLVKSRENNLISLEPGNIKYHKEGMKAVYATVHSYVHAHPGIALVAPSNLELELNS